MDSSSYEQAISIIIKAGVNVKVLDVKFFSKLFENIIQDNK